jgi:hypothetical protein
MAKRSPGGPLLPPAPLYPSPAGIAIARGMRSALGVRGCRGRLVVTNSHSAPSRVHRRQFLSATFRDTSHCKHGGEGGSVEPDQTKKKTSERT